MFYLCVLNQYSEILKLLNLIVKYVMYVLYKQGLFFDQLLFSFIILVHYKENMSMKCVPPQTPLLYSKTGICRGISIFLIFAPKHSSPAEPSVDLDLEYIENVFTYLER